MRLALLIGLIVATTASGRLSAAPKRPLIPYRVVETGGSKRLGPWKAVLVDPKFRNEKDMRVLAEQLREEFKTEKRAEASVYDDEYAASLFRALTMQPHDRMHRDKHYIGHYLKDPWKKSHLMRIMLEGPDGPVIEVKF